MQFYGAAGESCGQHFPCRIPGIGSLKLHALQPGDARIHLLWTDLGSFIAEVGKRALAGCKLETRPG